MAHLIKENNNWVIRDDWHESNFQDRALERLNRLLTPQELGDAMELVVRAHDANVGINWGVIDGAFDSIGFDCEAETEEYETKWCMVLDTENGRTFDVKIALGWWNEKEDAEDESIFFYMDSEPLQVGTIISEHFLVTHIEE
jgi:hypothetical protein